ncbi:glycoside hydrolase family 9 protein [Microbulbifer agarilyticus]
MRSTKSYKRSALITAAITGSTLTCTPVLAANYGEALQKSIYFYEAQQSGPIPFWNRNEWRGDSGLQDGKDNNIDLTGGWYDAGDHVKFGFPMAATATMLAWGAIENREAYELTGQLQHLKNNLKFVADYFVKAHTAPNELWGQVGEGAVDHAWWGSAEVMQMARPSYKVNENCPGSDIAGETAAALAAIYMVFASSEPEYANKLLDHAKQLYSFADNYRGKYSDCITDATAFYNSWSGYNDELVWGAAWLYRATGDQAYLDKANSYYGDLSTEQQSTTRSYKWTHAWDDKGYGSYVLMSLLTDNPVYRADAERWLDYWTSGYNGDRVRYTPGGLAHLDQWGAARYTSNTAFIALVYSDYLKSIDPENTKAQIYYDFAVSQMEYLLGDNPMNMSYQIGYGSVYPTSPHHRTAHGSWNDSLSDPVGNRHTLVGALVGGPDTNDGFVNDRGDYILNEVATDYNAGFTGALARLWLDFGGNPIAEENFPAAEARDTEFFVDAKLNSSGNSHTEIAARVHNRSAWPAKLTNNLRLRYWLDISELVESGYSASDLQLNTAYSQGSDFTGPHPWGDPADNIYYVEVSFEGVDIFPGGQSQSKKESQFRMGVGNGIPWNPNNDPSWDSYGSNREQALLIALYDNGELVWGQEPGEGCGGASGINCIPQADEVVVQAGFESQSPVALSGYDSDGSIVSYTVATQPGNGSLTGDGASRLYTPDAGYFGSDSFTYTVTDNAGAISNPATVSIQVEAPPIPAVSITSPSNGSRFKLDEDITVEYTLQYAEGINLYLNGVLTDSATGSGNLIIAVPTVGDHQIELRAINDGEELSATDAISVTVEQLSTDGGDEGLVCTISSADTWSDGFVLNDITLTNKGGTAVQHWEASITFESPITLINGWSGEYNLSTDGRVVTVTNAPWNGSLANGNSAVFGFQGEHNGNFALPTCRAD